MNLEGGIRWSDVNDWDQMNPSRVLNRLKDSDAGPIPKH